MLLIRMRQSTVYKQSQQLSNTSALSAFSNNVYNTFVQFRVKFKIRTWFEKLSVYPTTDAKRPLDRDPDRSSVTASLV